MKPRLIQILSMVAVVAAGAVFLRAHHEAAPTAEPSKSLPPKAAVPVQKEVVKPTAHASPSPIPPTPKQRVATPPTTKVAQPAPRRHVAHTPSAAQQHAAMVQYWKRAEDNFNRQWDLLDSEQDAAKRDRLIQAMAQHVRMDTLATIEWAMGLKDPEERRLAMEAINKYALSGIGARIAIDETGFPKIAETTALSAVASTGMVEPGDYIVGMVNENGETISFKNLPIQQIVNNLRGQPGSDVELLMERTPGDGSDQSYTFDVPVQRSMLVIQPPY